MRDYHPLDVRHPSNRDLLRRNYLLDPPSPTVGTAATAPARRAPAASGHREARPAPSQPVAPWGQRAQSARPATTPAHQTQRKSGGFLWNAFIVLLFLVIFGSQNGWFDSLLDSLRLLARQNGVTLPF